jgi:glycopeptide antibiotics resistance protein
LTFSRKTAQTSKIYPEIWRFIGYSITFLIIYFSLNPAYPLKQAIINIPLGDQLIHLCAFGFLMYCFCQFWKQNPIRIILGAGLVFLGIGLETLQTTLGGKPFEFEDGFANTVGVGLGYLVSSFRN